MVRSLAPRSVQPGDNFFVVEDGKYEAWLEELGRTNPVKTYESGTGFGERALLQNVPRAASVECVEAGRVWAISRIQFRKITMGVLVTQASTRTDVAGEEEEEEEPAEQEEPAEEEGEAAKQAAKDEEEASAPADGEQAAMADGEQAAATADGEQVAAIVGGMARETRTVVKVTYESEKLKRQRKQLRNNKTLKNLLGVMWDAADQHLSRMYRPSYLNYHLSLNRFVLKTTGEEDEYFDAIDAFEEAMLDWERDTDHGSLPAIHQEALEDSLFEVIDLYTETLSEKDYIEFARLLNKECTIKPKGQKRRFRHMWTISKDGAFLCRAILGLQGLLPVSLSEPLPAGELAKSGSKAAPTVFSLRGLIARVMNATKAAADVVEKSISSGVEKLAELSGGGRKKVAPLGAPAARTSGTSNPQAEKPEAAQGRGAKKMKKKLLKGVSKENAAKLQERREEAVEEMFNQWATPIFDVEENRLRNQHFIGNRRHADDERAIRLGALSHLLSDAGVAIHRGDEGLPQLLAAYNMLDLDGDGWITWADFRIAILDLTVDPQGSGKQVPTLPEDKMRGVVRGARKNLMGRDEDGANEQPLPRPPLRAKSFGKRLHGKEPNRSNKSTGKELRVSSTVKPAK